MESTRDLNQILVFSKVVECGSFVGAARALAMPKSTVSRKVSELEERLGARLLQRTTRKLNLTDVGHTYYRHAARVVAELEEAELAVTRMQETPRGLLRVTMPLNLGFMAPVVSSFMKRFPEVRLDIVCAERNVDLIEEGFDVAVRAGALSDSTLVARALGSLINYVVASPAFIRKHGVPSAPQELARLPCIAFGAGGERDRWQLSQQGKTLTVDIAARLVVNDYELLEDAACAGLGIALLPPFHCQESLAQKRLRRLLPAWSSRPIPLHAVYPSTRHLSPKVKAFVDHVGAALGKAARQGVHKRP